MSPLILVVDDEENVAEMLKRLLRREGHEVLVAQRGREALEMARQGHPDLMVLDDMMPGMSSADVCRQIRADPELTRTPVLYHSSREYDRLEALEAGVDDYLARPFDLRDVAVRVRVLLRQAVHRAAGEVGERIAVGALVLDCRTFVVSTPEGTSRLMPVELEILRILMLSPGKVIGANELAQEVWGHLPGTADLVRSAVRDLRSKLEPDPRRPRYLVGVPGRGFRVMHGDTGVE